MSFRCWSLAFSLFAVGSIPATVSAQTVGGISSAQFELKGLIVDVARAPIAGAEIVAMNRGNTLTQVLTAHDGSFTLVGLPAGPVTLRFRRLGYEPKTVEMQIGLPAAAPLDIVLTASATELKEVVIKVEDAVTPLDEFNLHRKQNRGTAKFYDQEQIRKRGAIFASDLFRTVPGVRVQTSMTRGNEIRIRGCQPIVWIDGQRVPGVELDEVTTPGDIAGIEFYPSMAGTPAKYSERSARPCGTLLVWTKTR